MPSDRVEKPPFVTKRTIRDSRNQRKRASDGHLAVAYLRVSTEEQALGPEAQRAAIEGWALQEGVRIVAWHLDQGVSGAAPVDEREGLLGALQALEEHGAGVLVVAKWDRLGRDVYLSATIERLVERMGAGLVSADGVGNGEGPEQTLLRQLIRAFAEYERALIRSRTRAALAAKKARGERSAGRVPLGFQLAEDGVRLEPETIEQQAIQLAKRLHGDGFSLRAIGAELAQKGFQPRGGRWHPQTVARMIAA